MYWQHSLQLLYSILQIRPHYNIFDGRYCIFTLRLFTWWFLLNSGYIELGLYLKIICFTIHVTLIINFNLIIPIDQLYLNLHPNPNLLIHRHSYLILHPNLNLLVVILLIIYILLVLSYVYDCYPWHNLIPIFLSNYHMFRRVREQLLYFYQFLHLHHVSDIHQK